MDRLFCFLFGHVPLVIVENEIETPCCMRCRKPLQWTWMLNPGQTLTVEFRKQKGQTI